jgi:Fanconi-associated nuclease 1
LGRTFTLADSSETGVSTLEEASSLLNLEELKLVARDAKVQGKNKAGLLKALHLMSRQQSGLGWIGLKRSDSELDKELEDVSATPDSFDDMNRDRHFVRKILAITGPCIRLSLPALKLFERVHLVFYRSSEWTDKSLTTIILSSISRRVFPRYIVSRSANMFSCRSSLLEFEAAIRTQFRIDNILEFGGHFGQNELVEVLSILDAILPRWRVLVKEEQTKEDRLYETGEGAYLRRFSPAWVYTRIIHKATSVLGKFKMYEREHCILTELLGQPLFHSARRGSWFVRKALLEEHYMATLQHVLGVGDLDQSKRHWKRISLRTCEEGLQDR